MTSEMHGSPAAARCSWRSPGERIEMSPRANRRRP
jgi:hypothetical protein